MRAIALPADGVKGKTWGPSSVHGRSRGHLPLPALARPKHAPRFSSSAPDLPPAIHLSHAGKAPPPPPLPPLARKPRKSRSREPARRRAGSHDDLLADEPRRPRAALLCPMFASHHYDAVFDLPDKAKRKGSHGEVKKTLLRGLRSNSLTGLFAAAAPDTADLLADD